LGGEPLRPMTIHPADEIPWLVIAQRPTRKVQGPQPWEYIRKKP
jgi:hypothetical protein